MQAPMAHHGSGLTWGPPAYCRGLGAKQLQSSRCQCFCCFSRQVCYRTPLKRPIVRAFIFVLWLGDQGCGYRGIGCVLSYHNDRIGSEMDSHSVRPSMSQRRINEGHCGIHHTMLEVVDIAILRLERFLEKAQTRVAGQRAQLDLGDRPADSLSFSE